MRRVGGESAVLALTDGPEEPALLDVALQAGHRQARLLGRPEDPCRALARGYVARLVGVHEDSAAGGEAAGEAGWGEGGTPQADRGDAAVGRGTQGGRVVGAVRRAEQAGADAEAGPLAADPGAPAGIRQPGRGPVAEEAVPDADAERAQAGEVAGAGGGAGDAGCPVSGRAEGRASGRGSLQCRWFRPGAPACGRTPSAAFLPRRSMGSTDWAQPVRSRAEARSAAGPRRCLTGSPPGGRRRSPRG